MTATDDVTRSQPPAEEKGIRAYLKVVKTPGMPAWTFVVLCQRLPIAMSPLALVYLGHLAGSYAIGALLAGAFAFAEAIAAGVMGRRFDRRPAGPELRLVLTVQAAVLVALAVPAMVSPGWLPAWAMIALAAVAGGVASGAHGGLRALLVRTVDASAHHAALSLEATLTTLLWAIGPAIVGLIALVSGQVWPILVIAAIAAVGALGSVVLKDTGRARDEDGAKPADVRVWRLSWPALFQEGAVMLCVGAAYTGLPSLLELVGTDAGIAGPVLAVFAVAGLIGGLVYGSRKWPGAYRSQSFVLVIAVTVVVAAAVVSPTAATIIALMILSGLAGTPALTARAAGMQELLPERVWATGFSGLYAAGGVGFGVAGLVVAALLEPIGIRGSLLVCVAIAALAAVVSGVAEARRATNPAGAR
jgi:MFS family permease